MEKTNETLSRRLIIKENESLSRYSTMGVGGNARFFCEVHTLEQLQEALVFAKERKIPFFPLGKGSNSLFSDKGYAGLVILLKISHFRQQGNRFVVGAGYSFSRLGQKSASLGFAGLEFASGIPGSVGGAVFMNAGASGAETADCLEEVQYLDDEGELHVRKKKELSFSYRYSSFQKMRGIITEATFILQPDPEAKKRQKEIISQRRISQPYEEKSCGCIFRNPLGGSAGQLIDQCCLKGISSGNAEVSLKHANFIVNKGNATAQDIEKLLFTVQAHVKMATGIELEPEVRFVPYEEEKNE